MLQRKRLLHVPSSAPQEATKTLWKQEHPVSLVDAVRWVYNTHLSYAQKPLTLLHTGCFARIWPHYQGSSECCWHFPKIHAHIPVRNVLCCRDIPAHLGLAGSHCIVHTINPWSEILASSLPLFSKFLLVHQENAASQPVCLTMIFGSESNICRSAYWIHMLLAIKIPHFFTHKQSQLHIWFLDVKKKLFWSKF